MTEPTYEPPECALRFISPAGSEVSIEWATGRPSASDLFDGAALLMRDWAGALTVPDSAAQAIRVLAEATKRRDEAVSEALRLAEDLATARALLKRVVPYVDRLPNELQEALATWSWLPEAP